MEGVQRHGSIVPRCDARELEELVERFAHRVFYFARRIEARFGLDPQWRDDLVSSGYWGLLKALRNRRAGAHEHELSAYVSKRIEGAVLDEARRALTRVTSRADLDPEELDGSSLPLDGPHRDWEAGRSPLDPEDLADQQGRWRRIERSFETLGDDHRALLWSYAEGSSLSEIARRDGLSPSRLQSRMTQAAREIRARSPELRRILRREI